MPPENFGGLKKKNRLRRKGLRKCDTGYFKA
jgi:hypothetical protein